jgi:hypothetical protein
MWCSKLDLEGYKNVSNLTGHDEVCLSSLVIPEGFTFKLKKTKVFFHCFFCLIQSASDFMALIAPDNL